MISVQLWSLRDRIAEMGVGFVVEQLAGEGFVHVEPFDIANSARALSDALERTGITVPTAHGDLRREGLAASLDGAASVGATLLMHPAFLLDQWVAPDGVARIAETLNEAAEAAAPYGIRVAFHNHADELVIQHGDRPALIALMDEVCDTVGVQYDPYWTTIAGANVLDAIEALGPHLFALHLKDGPVGGPNEAQVAVGKGDLPIREYLAAVSTAVPRVISLDLYSGDAFAAVVESKRWLEIESSRASR